MVKIDGSKMATGFKNAFQKVPKIAKWPRYDGQNSKTFV